MRKQIDRILKELARLERMMLNVPGADVSLTLRSVLEDDGIDDDVYLLRRLLTEEKRRQER